jgi:hypothetical protein
MIVNVPAQKFSVPNAGGTVQIAVAVTPDAPPNGGGDTPPARRLRPFGGYGPVSYWWKIDADALGTACFEAGLTCVEIESGVPDTGGGPDADLAAAGASLPFEWPYPRPTLADLARFVHTINRHKLTVWFVGYNDNAQDAVHAQATPTWGRDYVQRIKAAVGDVSGMIFEGVSEPRDDDAIGTMQAMRDEWGAGRFIANAIGGHGREPIGAAWRSEHMCDDLSRDNIDDHLDGDAPGHVLFNSDCSPNLNPGPTRAAAQLRAGIDADACFMVYDQASGFNGQFDRAVIAALSAEVQKGGRGTAPYVP